MLRGLFVNIQISFPLKVQGIVPLLPAKSNLKFIFSVVKER